MILDIVFIIVILSVLNLIVFDVFMFNKQKYINIINNIVNYFNILIIKILLKKKDLILVRNSEYEEWNECKYLKFNNNKVIAKDNQFNTEEYKYFKLKNIF